MIYCMYVIEHLLIQRNELEGWDRIGRAGADIGLLDCFLL